MYCLPFHPCEFAAEFILLTRGVDRYIDPISISDLREGYRNEQWGSAEGVTLVMIRSSAAGTYSTYRDVRNFPGH